MATLTVVTTTYNEEAKIAAALESVRWAEELLVVDGFSQDSTVQIARHYTPHVFQQPNHPNWNANKNFGFDRARGDWVLSLDADERVTPELAAELRAVLLTSPLVGYRLVRQAFFFGRRVRYGGVDGRHLRLFRRGAARFPCRHPHEGLELLAGGTVGDLRAPLQHDSYDDIADFVRKVNVVTSQEADYLLAQGYRVRPHDLVLRPLRDVWRRYVRREGYRDGALGLVVAGLYAGYEFLSYAKAWERQTR
ncbi:MAG: glycosyltransferase family 2 protein [Chloroflexi bacterium]|nr:glycosyltransferase family 2 protein [Chloroflexota bacterium]